MSQVPVLYQETQLSPTSITRSQIIHINTAPGSEGPAFGAGRKRGFDEISGLDEEQYARKYLASEGSVFFRRKSRAPRSFLWRVVDDRKVLEIQSVDLVHDKSNARSDSCLTFRLGLPGEIIRNGVAFADPDETDALEAFVLTMQNELYTFTLKRDLLTRDSVPNEFDPKTCFRRYTSSSLSFRQPFRLVAISSLELLVSLGDGGMIRFERQPNESGAQWKETLFSEGGWTGTLRGMIPGNRNRVKYGEMDLDAKAIAGMAKSPDGKYIWTVQLDHELKAWSTTTAKLVAGQDLSNEERREDGRRKPKYTMAAEQGTLLQILTPPPPKKSRSVVKMDEDGKYFIVLHSPKDHQFKFYEIGPTFSSADGQDHQATDLQPASILIPPIDELMNTNIWHLEDFFVQPGEQWEGTQLWLRARSGSLCRTFALTFDLLTLHGDDLALAWKNEWVAVDPGIQTTEAIKERLEFPGDLENFAEDAESPNEKWIDFLFVPGRFTAASMETALHIYSQGRNLTSKRITKGLKKSDEPLKERLVQAITAKIILTRLANEQPTFAKYHADVQEQWKMFFSLLSHLHSLRQNSIGFAFDAEDALPWSVCADFVAPVTVTSHFDNLVLNNGLLQEDVIESIDGGLFRRIFSEDDSPTQSKLLAMMKEFCGRLSSDFRQSFRKNAIHEALNHGGGDREYNTSRVQAIYEANKISEHVMDDDFQALENSAEEVGGLGNMTDDAILAVLELLGEDEEGLRKQKKAMSLYGDKFMVAAAQEILEKDQATLLAVLLFVVFMYGDLDQADLHETFVSEIGPLYETIIMHLRHNALLSWLASNEIPDDSRRGSKSSDAEVSTVTLLERNAIGDWEPRHRGNEELPQLLTMWSRLWIYGPYINLNQNWDGFTGHILAFLIKDRHLELATEFQKFLTPTENAPGWIKYLVGRLHLATGDYMLASLQFRAAADDMAQTTHSADSASLLSPEERNYFGVGHASFYQHVTALYEKLMVFSYTADFAALALKHLKNDFNQARRSKGARPPPATTDSPEVSMIDNITDEIGHHLTALPMRDELAGRLFNALVQTGRFRGAFDALNEIDNLNVKKANLRDLVEKCVKQDAVPDLLALPFEDANLVQEADAIFYTLAKKSLASGSTSSVPYYQILYSFRTQRSDFRGAAVILYEHLERLSYTQRKHGLQDMEDETLIEAYVLLINTLACCGQEDAWLLADPIEGVHGEGKKRRLVTIDEVRREYEVELDRRSDILQGRFPLVGGDEMDVF